MSSQPKQSNLLRLTFVAAVIILAGLAIGFGPQFFKPEDGPLKPPDLSAGQSKVNTDEVVIFFSKAKGAENITEAVTRPVPSVNQQNQLEFAIQQLLIGPNNDESIHGYFSEIPKGARLLSITKTDKEITVDLSKQFTSGGGANSMAQRLTELKSTIKDIEPSKPVYVTIEGQSLELLGGEGLEITEPINKSGEGELL